MDKDRKVFTSIYAKIYLDTFDENMADRLATGTEIYEFLMADANLCVSEDGQIIPGDCNLWYLGCNEKIGFMVLEDAIWTWDPGESSFDIPLAYVVELKTLGIITKKQFQILIDKIAEGRLIDNMYDIGKYLISKQDGKPWSKTEDASTFRDDIKKIVGGVKKSFRNNGYQFYI
jgi:hypothetical protein